MYQAVASPLDGGVGGEDQLLDLLLLQAALQDIEPQLLRADTVKGRQVAHQHEVTAGELAGLLDGGHVRRALHHAEQAVLLALGIGADPQRSFSVKVRQWLQ